MYLIVIKDVQVSEVKDCIVFHLKELMEDTDIYVIPCSLDEPNGTTQM